MTDVQRIGFFTNGSYQTASLPSVEEFVDVNWDEAERARVISYLEAAPVISHYRGWSNCRVCNKPNGSSESWDEVFLWPQGYSHYVREHNVKPPQEFVNHVLNSK